MKNVIICIGLSLMLFSCKKNTNQTNEQTNGEQTLIDVAYANQSTKQKMDVYLPANRGLLTYPIIMIHGGGWNGGDKDDFKITIADLKPLFSNEYAIFNINYRLANGSSVLVPQQINDITDAINFIHNNAATYNINTSKIGLLGASAGAHLSLLKAYTQNTDAKIKVVVDLFGPTDMAWMYSSHPLPTLSQPSIVNAVSGTPLTNATGYTNASPINFVSASVPPTIIFHGTDDLVVPIAESDKLKAKLQTAGVTNQYVVYTGEAHGWVGAKLNDTYNKAFAFIKTHLK